MNKKMVIELIRVSTPGQAADDKAGIPAQRMINRRTIETNDLEVFKTIEMIDIKGADILQAPAMQELLKLIESPEISGVVTKEFARLMRPQDPSDFVILGKFLATNTLLYLPDVTIDFSTPPGFLYGILKAAIAGMEALEIRNRTNDGKEAKRLAGEHASGRTTLPFAVRYDRRRKKWFYDLAEMNKVKAAFRMVLKGELNLAKIARKLKIPRTTLRYILQNRTYTGIRAYEWMRDPHGQVWGPDGKRRYTRKIPRPADRVRLVEIDLPPLVSKEDFERVQELLEIKRKRHWRHQSRPRPAYVFAGFLWCHRCGSRLYGHTGQKPHYVCKACTTRERQRREALGLQRCDFGYVNRDRLELSLHELLSNRLLNRSFLKSLVKRLRAALRTRGGPRPSIRDLQLERKRLDARRMRVWEDLNASNGRMTISEANTLVDHIDQEIAATEEMITEARRSDQLSKVLDVRVLRRLLRPLCQWRYLTSPERVAILQQLGTRITLDRYVIKGISFELMEETTCSDNDERRKTGP